MIITRQKHIPIHWVLVAIAPWAAYGFAGGAMNAPFLFSLKKFIDNPAGLTFILTLPSYISIVLWPACSFLSDRIWTRFGRRKPFIIASWIGMLISLLLMPFMPNLWALVATYMLFCMSSDLGAPLEPLKQEIIPPHQRGFAMASMSWLGNLSGLLFSYVAIGRFDDVRFLAGHQVTGESLLYWSGVLILLVTFFLLTLGIKEIDPQSPLVGQKLSIKVFFVAILDRDLWPVYMLIFGAAMLGAGLGPLGNLLYTDQWNYSKQEMGTNIAAGACINFFVIGILAFIADRLDRMKAYQVLITMSLIVQFFYYIYVEFLLPDRHPSLVEIIFFGETLSILGILTTIIYVPLVYDYIIRDKMGTYAAGAGLLNRVTGILTLNAIGLFVWAYAIFFQPPAGEMARVCLDHEMTSAEVKSMAQKSAWKYPDGTPASSSQINVNAWYANGIISDRGSSWEIRLRDPKSEHLSAQLENLQSDLSPVLDRENTLRDAIQIDLLQNKPDDARADQERDCIEKARIDLLNAQIGPLQEALKSRGDDFQKQVATVFGPSLLVNGNQILSAQIQDSLLLNLAVTRQAGGALEKTLIDLRRQGLNVIDLRRIRQGDAYGVAASALPPPGANEETFAQQLAESLTRLANKREANLFPTPPQMMSKEHPSALTLDLKIVEKPLDDRISPITRVVHWILNFFDCAPQPEHRLAATARSLRLAGETEHVGVAEAPEKGNVISVLAILLPTAAKSQVQDAVTQRLQGFLGNAASTDMVAQARAFYDRVVDAAAVQRITIQRPLLDRGYVDLRYDYMSGYIPIFVLSLIGLFITFGFARRERRGLISKLGVEEAEAS